MMKKLLLLICIGAMLVFVAYYRQGTQQKAQAEQIGSRK
jgi:preprotein translocase subunit YajC